MSWKCTCWQSWWLGGLWQVKNVLRTYRAEWLLAFPENGHPWGSCGGCDSFQGLCFTQAGAFGLICPMYLPTGQLYPEEWTWWSFLLPHTSQMFLLKAETIKCNYVPHAFSFSLLKPLLLTKALYLFVVVLVLYLFCISCCIGVIWEE